MDNNLILFDRDNTKDHIKNTKVVIYTKGTNEILFQGKNKVIVPGSAFTASKHFNIPILNTTPTYNQALQLENTIPNDSIQPNLDEKVVLFSVGTDGCGPDQHQVYDVDYSMWCPIDKLVPFRLVPEDADIPIELRDVYFGRKKLYNNTMIAYYFKAFDSNPTWNQRYVSDGTPVGNDIYSNHRRDEIESFIELKLSISHEDCREFFQNTVGLNHAKINTLSLLIAHPVEVDGIIYYQDIRPLTKINFPNEPLLDLNKGLDIIYHIYY